MNPPDRRRCRSLTGRGTATTTLGATSHSQYLQAWLGVPNPATEHGRQALQAGLERLAWAIVQKQREDDDLIRRHGGLSAMPTDVHRQRRELLAHRSGLEEALALLLGDNAVTQTHGALLEQVRNVVGPLWPSEVPPHREETQQPQPAEDGEEA